MLRLCVSNLATRAPQALLALECRFHTRTANRILLDRLPRLK